MKISNRAKSALATAGYSTSEDSAIAQLMAFAAQNSGIERGNYYNYCDPNKQALRDGRRAFTQEGRSISADWKRCKDALIQCAVDGVTDADVIAAAPGAFSGRLEWKTQPRNELYNCPTCHGETELNGSGGISCFHCGFDSKAETVGSWDYCTGQYFPTEYRKAAASVLEAAAREKRRTRPPEQRMPGSIQELKQLNRKNGGCWFEPDTMRFFGTRICGGVQFGRYFITSEQPPHGSRKYSVRSFDDKGDVDTVGGFCAHNTQAQAQSALRSHAAADSIKAA